MKRFLTTATVITMAVVVSAGYVRATVYRFTTIDYPAATYTYAEEINDFGQIVGSYMDTGGVWHGFTLIGGVYTSFDHPDATGEGTAVYGINSLGQIVGGYRHADGTFRGFLLDGVNYTELRRYEGSPDTTPVGINDAGQVVGYFLDDSFVEHGFLFDGTDYTTIDDTNAARTFAWDINNAGVIVGSGWESGGYPHAFIRETDGTLSTFFVSGYPADATGINDVGQIAGNYGPAYDDRYGYVLSGGVNATPYKLVAPGAAVTEAWDINNLGHVVGAYWDFTSDNIHGFLATPIPEPATVWLLLMALGGSVLATRNTF